MGTFFYNPKRLRLSRGYVDIHFFDLGLNNILGVGFLHLE